MEKVFDVYRREFAERVLADAPHSLLEVGSGDGDFLKTVRGNVHRLAGLDPSDEHFAALRTAGFELHQGGAERLPFEDRSFDTVVFSFTPHHIDDWRVALNEALRVARRSVHIMDGWYDVALPDQKTTFDYENWCKAVDRRMGMAHNPVVMAAELLRPIAGRADLAADYVQRRIAAPSDQGEMTSYAQTQLAKIKGDQIFSNELTSIYEAIARHGSTVEGVVMVRIQRG
jgi:ubiquinone/menaquinone biosynthesis C-methylase UbiE